MIVLIPMNCWKAARPTATTRAGRSHRAPRAFRPASLSLASISLISSIRSCGSSSAPTWSDWTASSTSRALRSCPLRTRKRGVSGTKKIPMSRTNDGTAASPSMMRQSPDEAKIALTMKATRMPTTIIIWFSEETAPRISVGAISDR